MVESRVRRVLMGIVLLSVSCGGGGGGGPTGAAGDAGGRGPGGSGGGTGGSGGGRGGTGGTTGAGGVTGGAGADGHCANVPPCGGDIAGTWKVTQSCVTATQDLGSVCPGASAEVSYAISGTIIYGSDRTYTPALAATLTVHEHYPAGCMPFGLTCAQLEQAAADASAPVSSARCAMDASGTCNCDTTETGTVNNAPGTYSTSGDTLTSVQGSTTSTAAYCVQAGTLHELPAGDDGGLTASGDLVLVKQ